MLPLREEKRRFPRLNVAHPVHYQIAGTPEYADVLTNNISTGGIGFLGNRFIPTNTPLKLQLNLQSRVLSSMARVTRSQPIPHSDRYYSGIEFVDLNKDDRKHLSDYINLRLN